MKLEFLRHYNTDWNECCTYIIHRCAHTNTHTKRID